MDYKVTDSELTGIANAIRTKGGTSSPLVFPNGFTSAIEAIPTGGGNIYTKPYPPYSADGSDGDLWLQYESYINVTSHSQHCVDTGIPASSVYGFYAKIISNQSGNYQGFFGATRDVFTFGAFNNITTGYYRNQGVEVSKTVPLEIKIPNIIVLQDRDLKINGSVHRSNISMPVEKSNVTVCYTDTNQSSRFGAMGRYYDFSLSDSNGDELVHLYPDIDSNNVICMYDTISKQHFYSSGNQSSLQYGTSDSFEVYVKTNGSWTKITV